MTPKKEGYSQPAEWAGHEGCWLAWPSAASLWEEGLLPAQQEFAALCQEIAKSETVHLLVPNDEAKAAAKKALGAISMRFYSVPYGDIWLRDTAPVFLKNAKGERAAVRFGFNGWGEKYVLAHDAEVSDRVAKASGLKTFRVPEVLEGGSVEVDGDGTCLTTEQCLLNPNRNREMTRGAAEAMLRESLGVEKVLWLKEGLLNDHTDGHIDTIARFAAPGVVLCMQATDKDDPNHVVYEQIATDLQTFTDAKGRALKVIRIPSPGKVLNEDGEVMPASYLNFYISNGSVIVPVYGADQDEAAVQEIAKCFPGRNTLGLSAIALLAGGGAFHCISQQLPV